MADRETGKRTSAERDRQADDWLRDAFEHAGVGLAIIDDAFRIQRCNAAYARLTRRGEPELVGLRCLDFTHPDDALNHLRAQAEVDARGRAEPFDKRYLTPGGEPVHVRITLSRAGPDAMLAVVEDVTARVLAEQALAKRTRELESVMLAAPAAIYVNDRTARRTLFANDAIASMFGLTRADLEAMPPGALMDLVHPDDLGIVQAMLAEVDRSPEGMPVEAEYRFRHKDGGYRVIADRVVAIGKRPDGTTERILGVAIDVTERRRAQAALAESEALFRAAQETSPDGFMVFDTVRGSNGEITDFAWRYVNEAGARIVGRPRAWFPEKRLLVELPGNREEGLFDIYRRVVDTGEGWTSELSYNRDGVNAFIRLVATKVGDGFAVSFADLSERERAEKRLRDSERRFRAAIDAIEGILWTSSAGGQMEGEQPAWASLTGQSRDEYQGTGWTAAVHQDDVETTLAAWRDAVAHGEPFEVEHRIRRHDGVWRRYSVRAVPVRNPSGAIREWVGVHTDITDRLAAAEALAASERRLRQGLEAGRMAAWEWDLATGNAERSDNALALFGLETSGADEFIANIHPDDRLHMIAARDAALCERADYAVEFRYRHPDGRELWVADRAQVIRDADGRAVKLAGIAQDVTTRKATELALAESEQRLRRGLEAGRMVAWETDLRTGASQRSDSVRAVFGLPEAAEDDFAQLVHPEDQARVRAVRDAAIDDGRSFSLEFRLCLPDDREVWVANQAQVDRDTGGRAVRLAGITQDITARKTAELALAASEAEARARSEELRAVLDAAQAAIWIAHDPDCRSITGNRFAAALVRPGVESDYSLSNPSPGVPLRIRHLRDGRELAPDDMPLQRACRGEDDGPQELTFRFDDGREVTLFGVATALRDDTGRIRGAVYAGIDVTARKVAEAKLRATLAEVETVLDSVPAAVLIARDPSCVRIDSNRYAREMLRLAPGRRVSKSAPDAEAHVGHYQLFATDGHPLATDELPVQRAARGEIVRDMEVLIRFSDGEERWAVNNATPILGPDGQPTGAVSTAIDLTARKQAEARLAETTRRLDAILANTRMAVFLMDGRQHCVYANAAAEALTGYRFADMQGRPLHDVVHHKRPDGSHYPLEECPIDRAFPERAQMEGEELFVAPDGAFYPVAFTASPVMDGDRPIGTVIEARNVADERAQRAELHRLNRELADQVAAAVAAREAALAQLHESQKLETLGQLTGGIAHDFNNLLTPIVAGLDMLQRRFKDDERAVRLLSGAQQSAERARVLVSRLLAFARRQLLDPRPVDIAQLVAGMRDLIDRSLGPQVAVEVDVTPGLPPARIDANQLELALLNLCVNARDAMPGGGKLTIAADVADDDEVAEAGLPPGRYVRLCVIDTGVGMTPETLTRAIEPFYTTKGIGKGTGLGLSMVHGLAAQSGGALKLKSAPDEGTTATIWLPAAAEAAPVAAVPEEVEQAARPLSILLVDDEELVREAAADMLASMGHRVTQAASPQDALDTLRRGAAFDVMLTDYLMPGMTGAELVADARAIAPSLPAALLTGYAKLSDGEAAGLPRLSKPFRSADLARLLAEIADAPASKPA